MLPPAGSTIGPPLLPALIAASTVNDAAIRPEWEYLAISTLETTPSVTDTLSPPTGYPTTFTFDLNTGRDDGGATAIGGILLNSSDDAAASSNSTKAKSVS